MEADVFLFKFPLSVIYGSEWQFHSIGSVNGLHPLGDNPLDETMTRFTCAYMRFLTSMG